MAKNCAMSHFAIAVTDLDRSIKFYEKYGQLEVVKRREDPNTAWLSDRIRPFMLALLDEDRVDHPIKPPTHIGIICESKERVDQLAAQAKEEGILTMEPVEEVEWS